MIKIIKAVNKSNIQDIIHVKDIYNKEDMYYITDYINEKYHIFFMYQYIEKGCIGFFSNNESFYLTDNEYLLISYGVDGIDFNIINENKLKNKFIMLDEKIIL